MRRSTWSGPAERPPRSPSVWPKAQDFGFPDEEAAFALQQGHGIGLAIWEKPMISRLVSLEHPTVIEPGMVFALETYWPASDGWSAARIEEEVARHPDRPRGPDPLPRRAAPCRRSPLLHRHRPAPHDS